MSTSSTTTTFTNCKICRGGKLVEGEQIVVANDTGKIVHAKSALASKVIDLDGAIIAPGLIELQTNGMRGFHFTHFENDQEYAKKLIEVAQYLPSTGCTAFYATIPTVSSDDFKKILPSLEPREIPNAASLLGAHAEGPYLHSSKKGAHNASLFHQASVAPEEVYGTTAESNHILKLVTLAPELEHSTKLIETLATRNIRVSLGHSAASHSQGLAALSAGATCLTHTLNAMAPLHHRDPGLAGLITNSPMNSLQGPYFSIILDGNHLHPSVATMLFRANPSKCIIITDSIELAGLDDGTYPGHAQISFNQTKKGTKVVIEGTETLIGGCAGLGECVKNVMTWSGCGVAEAVRCASENVADLMGDEDRGKLEIGRRADFVVLDDEGQVSQTWILGRKVWESK